MVDDQWKLSVEDGILSGWQDFSLHDVKQVCTFIPQPSEHEMSHKIFGGTDENFIANNMWLKSTKK